MTTAHRITTSLTVALALGTSAAPAFARPYDLNPNGSPVPAATASTPTTSGPRSAVVSGGGYGSAAPTVVRVVDGNSGFDWGDASIGAAGGLALSTIGLGAALGMSQRRTRRARHTTSLTS